MDKEVFDKFALTVESFAERSFEKAFTETKVNNVLNRVVYGEDTNIDRLDIEVKFWIDRLDITVYINNNDLQFALDKSCFSVTDDYETWDLCNYYDDIKLVNIIFDKAEQYLQAISLQPVRKDTNYINAYNPNTLESATTSFKIKPLR